MSAGHDVATVQAFVRGRYRLRVGMPVTARAIVMPADRIAA